MQDSVTVGRRDGRVVLFNNTIRTALAFSWRAADAVATVIALKSRGLIAPDDEKVGAVSVRREGNDIILIESNSGQTVLICPANVALEISHAMKGHARLLEETEAKVADRVVFDNALLHRAGVPLGLTNNPYLKKQTGVEAYHNSALRKMIPTTVRARKGIVSTPDITKETKPNAV